MGLIINIGVFLLGFFLSWAFVLFWILLYDSTGRMILVVLLLLIVLKFKRKRIILTGLIIGAIAVFGYAQWYEARINVLEPIGTYQFNRIE